MPAPDDAPKPKPKPGDSPPRLRAAAACVACNKKKIRCVYAEGDSDQCTNCTRNHWPCTARERKRKRRKISAADNEAASPTTTAAAAAAAGTNHPYDNPPLLAPNPNRSSWEARAISPWESGRIITDPNSNSNHVAAAPPSASSAPTGTTSGPNQTPSTTAAPDHHDNSARLPTAGTPSLAGAVAQHHHHHHQQQQPDRHPFDPASDNSTFLGRSEYIGPMNEDRAKAYPAVATETLTELDLRILDFQHCFDLPPRAVREGLIDIFMKQCAPWMPIVERSWLMERCGNQPSVLLLQAVFLAASRVSSAPAVAAYASSNDFYRRAKALFWSGYEKNTITVVTAVCILHWYNPEGPEHFSINTSGFWSRIGVGLAYQIGLHKEPPPGREAALRRRLWWTIYARDALISAGHGRPRAVNLDDCEVRPLCIEDFYGSSANGALFIAYVEVSSILGELTQCCCRKSLTRQKRTNIENALYRWVRELPEQLRLFRKPTSSAENSPPSKLSLAPYSFEARQLHVPYFVIIAILYRSSGSGNCPSSAALLASSFVAGIFEDFLARDQIRSLGPIFTFYLLAAGFGLLHCNPHPHLWKRAEQDIHVVLDSLRELSKRWPSGIGSLTSLQAMTDEASKHPRTQNQNHNQSQSQSQSQNHNHNHNHNHNQDQNDSGGEERPQQSDLLNQDEQVYFSGFGTDLCRLGDVILAPYNHDFPDPSRRPEDDQYARTVSDMMTAGILAELKAPGDGSALDEYLPLAPLPEPQPSQNGPADPAEMTDEMFFNQYDGIGNWLLRGWDWNSDIPW